MDESTLITTGLAAYASKDLIKKVLGPSADYVGGEVKNLVAKANVNLSAVLANAAKKLGNRLNSSGSVNPRVVRQVWEEGQLCEDEIAVEYFGGLLASARSPDGKDDRAVNLLATVRALSVFDLRFHYLTYSLVRHFFTGRSFRVSIQEDRATMAVFMPFEVYMEAMNLKDEGVSLDIAAHSLLALVQHELIDHRFVMGPPAVLAKHCPSIKVPGIVLIPSFLGAELYLWAHGRSEMRIDEFLQPGLLLEGNPGVRIIEGAFPIREQVD